MQYFYLVTIVLLLISLIKDRHKTVAALKTAYRHFIKICRPFLFMIMLISVSLYFVPDSLLTEYLGKKNMLVGFISTSLLGSVILMPGFIAYPLCGILVKKGVTYTIISVFTTTLMMVGVLSYPVESEYFGRKITIIRNLLSYLIAIVIAVITGLIYGELF